MKDNQGFTLIELIVVILIIGVLAGGSIFGVSVLGFGSAKSSVERISAMLDYVQVENMTKSSTYYLVIEKGGSDYYLSVVRGTDTISTEKLKLTRGEITFQVKDDPTQYLVSDVPVEGRDRRDKLEVFFTKDTGGVGENTLITEKVLQIGVSTSRSDYSIRLVEATGKHYIE